MRKRMTWCLMLLSLFFGMRINVGAAECVEHNFEPIELVPTCDSIGYQGYRCTVCKQTFQMINTDALGHECSRWEVVTAASCTSAGVEEGLCTRCSQTVSRSIPQLQHTYERTLVPPTCTAGGYTQHLCPHCGDRFRTDYTDKTGHSYDSGVVTKEPTLTAMGRITYTCIACGDSYVNTTAKLVNPFEDLDKDKYYFDSVIWAVNAGITQGVDEDHFSPDDLCTRAQVVTFLWRSAGQPEPSAFSCPFSDVSPESYCYKAVLWAVEQGITSGVSAERFAPDRPCTRAQVVSFLHRAVSQPEPGSHTVFLDVSEEDYFFAAVSWAYERGITVGSGSLMFSPHSPCTRAQIVTFLYRARSLMT